jgi:hypothetical protein
LLMKLQVLCLMELADVIISLSVDILGS